MGVFGTIIALLVGAVCYYIHCKFDEKERTISDLKEELYQAKRELKFEQSARAHADELYNNLLADYYDDEDEQTMEIFIKGKDGTRAVKVPAQHISFKGGNK